MYRSNQINLPRGLPISLRSCDLVVYSTLCSYIYIARWSLESSLFLKHHPQNTKYPIISPSIQQTISIPKKCREHTLLRETSMSWGIPFQRTPVSHHSWSARPVGFFPDRYATVLIPPAGLVCLSYLRTHRRVLSDRNRLLNFLLNSPHLNHCYSVCLSKRLQDLQVSSRKAVSAKS